MSTINFTCPHCFYTAQLPSDTLGTQGNCPACETMVQIVAGDPRGPQYTPKPLATGFDFNHWRAKSRREYRKQTILTNLGGLTVITFPFIACAAEYFIPFYGVWLVVFFILLFGCNMFVDARRWESWESPWSWWQSHRSFKNWCELGIFILFPAALITCGIEKYNRWEGWDLTVPLASARRWFQTDTGLATSMTIGAVLLGLAFFTLQKGLSAIGDVASDVIATGIKKAKDND